MSDLMVVLPVATSFTSALLGTHEPVKVLAAPEHDDIAVSQFHHKSVFEADLLAAPLFDLHCRGVSESLKWIPCW